MKQIFPGQTSVTPAFRGLVRPVLAALLVGQLLAGCTAFYTKEPVVYRQNVAVFRVPAAQYPGGDIGDALPTTEPFPKLDAGALIAALGNLEYKRQSAWGETHARVFYEEELNLLAPTLAEAIARADPAYRLVVVNRFDPDKSVLSRMERNTLVIWTDAAGFNVIFGEIREEIPNNDFRVDQDWTEVLPVSFERSYPSLELVPADFFQLKQVRGYTHHTWAVIPVRDLAGLKYRPRDSDAGEQAAETDGADAAKGGAAGNEQSDGAKTGDGRTDAASDESYFKNDEENAKESGPAARLRKLKRALDEELITPEEYEAQRQRILGEF